MKNCDHFWELDLETIEDKIPTFRCINCGEIKKDSIPIFDMKKFESSIEGENK